MQYRSAFKSYQFCRDIDRDVIDSKSIRIWHPRLRYPLIDGEAVERGFWAVEDSPKQQLQQGLEVAPPGENTLILGGSGSGKTQILQAMAHAAIAQKREVIWLPGDIAIVWDFYLHFRGWKIADCLLFAMTLTFWRCRLSRRCVRSFLIYFIRLYQQIRALAGRYLLPKQAVLSCAFSPLAKGY